MSQTEKPDSKKFLPGSIPEAAHRETELNASCQRYLEAAEIDPDSFTSKVRAYFRLVASESWRASGEKTIRLSNSSTERICRELGLTNKAYASRLLNKLSLNHLFLLSLRWNIPLAEIFATPPQGIAIEASASTFNAIKRAISIQQVPPRRKEKWGEALGCLKESKKSALGVKEISEGDYCLLFRFLMDREWAIPASRTKQKMTKIAHRIILEHKEEDTKFVNVSNIDSFDEVLVLLKDGAEFWYLLMWARPLVMEFTHD